MRHHVVAVVAFALSCTPAAPPPRPVSNASGPARAELAGAPAPCAEDRDQDGDGIPDRCDACPREPGVLWDELPVIDGCSTAAFHGLVRPPESTIIRVVYPRDPVDVDPARVAQLAEALGAGSIDAIACVGVRTATERGGEPLARRRAEHVIAALAKRLPGTRFVAYTAVGDAPAADIGVLSRDGREVRRWQGDHFEFPAAEASRARLDEARRKPSPCGRIARQPLPPPRCTR